MNFVVNFFASSSGYMYGSRSLSISWLMAALIAIAAVLSTVQSAEAITLCNWSDLCEVWPPWDPYICLYMEYNILGSKLGCNCFSYCN